MTKTSDAHKQLLSFCNGQPGVAIGKEMIEYVIRNAIIQANIGGNDGQPIPFPSNNPWHTFPIAFSMQLDSTSVSVVFDPLNGPSGTNPLPQLRIDGLTATFSIHVHQTLFSTHIIKYSNVLAVFQITGKKLSLVKQRIEGDWENNPTGDTNELWRKMDKLPDGNLFTPALQDDWKTQERAYLLLAQDAIGASFIEAVMLPNILGMVKAFEFTGPINVSGTTDLIMLSGIAEWVFDCPRRPATPTLVPHVGSSAIGSGKKSIGELGKVTYELVNKSRDGEYPPMQNVENSDTGDVFVHLPTVFMQHRFDDIAKPSITFSDEGSVAIIHWHYEASIAPSPGSTLQISLETLWPTEFKVSLPLATSGGAGAGVKIACIDYEAVGLHFRGKIEPFEAHFKIGLDTSTADLYFESYLGNVQANGFAFDHFPSLGFPINEIADFILSSAASAVVNGQAGRILNVTRFSLAEFNLFKGFGKIRNLLSSVSESAATTYGISFTKA